MHGRAFSVLPPFAANSVLACCFIGAAAAEAADPPDFAAVSIIPQTRIGLTRNGHIALNLGVEIPVNEADHFDSVAQMSLLWDFADKPLWMGW